MLPHFYRFGKRGFAVFAQIPSLPAILCQCLLPAAASFTAAFPFQPFSQSVHASISSLSEEAAEGNRLIVICSAISPKTCGIRQVPHRRSPSGRRRLPVSASPRSAPAWSGAGRDKWGRSPVQSESACKAGSRFRRNAAVQHQIAAPPQTCGLLQSTVAEKGQHSLLCGR